MEVKNISVAVVGAGASGLASAAALFEAGVKNVFILESSNTIGGRISRYNNAIGKVAYKKACLWCVNCPPRGHTTRILKDDK